MCGCECLNSYLLSHLDEPIEIKEGEEGVDDNHAEGVDLEVAESPLDIFRTASNETTLISNFPNANSEESIISIAKVKDKNLCQCLMMIIVKNLHIHIYSQMVNLVVKLKEIYLYLQLNISISTF